MRTAFLLPAALLLLSGCGGAPAARPGERMRVEIRADRDSYSPVLSSTVGIGLTPVFPAGKRMPPFRFHWSASYGYFVRWDPPDYVTEEAGPNVSTTGGKLYWSYDPVDMDEEKPEVKIRLAVRDAKTLELWSETSMLIGWDGKETARVLR